MGLLGLCHSGLAGLLANLVGGISPRVECGRWDGVLVYRTGVQCEMQMDVGVEHYLCPFCDAGVMLFGKLT